MHEKYQTCTLFIRNCASVPVILTSVFHSKFYNELLLSFCSSLMVVPFFKENRGTPGPTSNPNNNSSN